MKKAQVEMEFPTLKAITAILEENDFHLRATRYFVREKSRTMRTAILVMKESVRKMEENTRWLDKEIGNHRMAA